MRCKKCDNLIESTLLIDDEYIKTSPRRNSCFSCRPFLPKVSRIKKKEKLKEKRILFKKKCIEYKGGKCSMCGYDKHIAALHFHHVDPYGKDFEISKANYKNWDDVKLELDKCLLVCANCHAEIHNS